MDEMSSQGVRPASYPLDGEPDGEVSPGEQPVASLDAASVLADPQADMTSWAVLAENYPELWDEICNHPRCYPELRSWIHEQHDVALLVGEPTGLQDQAASTAEDSTDGSPEIPGAGSRGIGRTGGSENLKHFASGAKNFYVQKVAPTVEKSSAEAKEFYQQMVAPAIDKSGVGAKELYMKKLAPAVEKSSAGAKDFYANKVAPAVEKSGSEAKESFENRVVLAAEEVAKSVQSSGQDISAHPGDTVRKRSIIPFILPALGVLGLICLMLPVGNSHASIDGVRVPVEANLVLGNFTRFGFFSAHTAAAGGWELFSMIVVIATAIPAILKKHRIPLLISAIPALILGVISMIVGFSLLGTMDKQGIGSFGFSANVTAGAGIVMLTIVSVMMSLVAAAICMLSMKRWARTEPGDPSVTGSEPEQEPPAALN